MALSNLIISRIYCNIILFNCFFCRFVYSTGETESSLYFAFNLYKIFRFNGGDKFSLSSKPWRSRLFSSISSGDLKALERDLCENPLEFDEAVTLEDADEADVFFIITCFLVAAICRFYN